jgi:uncharacterized protein YndB with AHSA1/START domain
MSDAANDQDHGQLERGGERPLLRFTRRFPHPPRTVWRALTEPEHLTAWFPTTIEGERATGAPLRFAPRDRAAPSFDGEMLAFEPPRLMELRWGDEILRFELQADGESGCVLVLSDAFDELGKAARDGAGWHTCLDLLAYETAGREAPWSSADRWRQLRGDYAERFGPEASTIGPPPEWEDAHGSASA